MATTKKPAKKPTPKKTTAKKATARKSTSPKKKPVAKKATAKKPVAKKAPTRATAKAPTLKPIPRRPSPNPTITADTVSAMSGDFEYLRSQIEEFAAHMRALDRKRLNGIGIKRQGFTERAFQLAVDNEEFLPHWLTLDKFREDMDTFIGLRNLVDLTRQIEELLWNLTMQASDMAYTDALEFYASVREASKRRVDAAESPFNELEAFFRSHGRRHHDNPTEAEIKRDMDSLLKGRKDGKIVLENFSPKTTGGSRKVVDETYKAQASFKDTEEGSLND